MNGGRNAEEDGRVGRGKSVFQLFVTVDVVVVVAAGAL